MTSRKILIRITPTRAGSRIPTGTNPQRMKSLLREKSPQKAKNLPRATGKIFPKVGRSRKVQSFQNRMRLFLKK